MECARDLASRGDGRIGHRPVKAAVRGEGQARGKRRTESSPGRLGIEDTEEVQIRRDNVGETCPRLARIRRLVERIALYSPPVH